MSNRRQRGQALILIALAFVGLAAFIGLAVDAGILFIQYGHLRRGVDAASLSAANQFREGRTMDQMTASALEILALNGLSREAALGVKIETCDTTPGDPGLCFSPPRKLVRVTGTVTAYFAFLPIIGIDSAPLWANAISEAASIDIVLVLDSSESMTSDAGCSNTSDDDAWLESPDDGDPNDGCDAAHPKLGDYTESDAADPAMCNPDKECRPFRDVQDAAVALTTRLLPPYDRMAIVTFDLNAFTHMSLDYQAVNGLSNPDYITALQTQIMALEVFDPPDCAGWQDADPMDGIPPTEDPRGCTTTNTADGLINAAAEFYDHKREEAVWIVILLSDGGANAAKDNDGDWICPGSYRMPDWIIPYCRDNDTVSRHSLGSADYDADDAARDRADFLGCLDENSTTIPAPGTCEALNPGYGDGAVIFTIGLGDRVTNATDCEWPGGCDADAGEQLLRYIANVGDDGNPLAASDPCISGSYGVGESCGNYYFSPTGSGLLEVFEAIASRIFTRITH